MNRIELPAKDMSFPSSLLTPDHSSEVSTVTDPRIAGAPVAPHATFAPMHYEDRYAYPLVVWLHGPQGNERRLRRIMPLVSMRNYVAIAPRGTRGDCDLRDAYDWQQTSDGIEEAESRIFDCIDFAKRRFNIHSDRVFLAGYGSGGTMALRVVWNNPQRFAGVATVLGPVPTTLRPFSRINQLRSIPCFLATAKQSRCYPEHHVCRDLRLLHAGGCTVALRQYPCEDDLTTAMLSDLDRWLMEQVCGSKET